MDFVDFVHDKDGRISQAASLLDEARAGLQTGALTRAQFDELVEDIMEIGKVEDIADSLEQKIAVQKTFELFKTLLGAIPK